MIPLAVIHWRLFYKRLYLYLLKELASLFFLSLFIFTFILVVSRIGRLADLVINKGVNLTDILLLVVYSFPAYLTFTFPMAFLLSIIVVLGRLASENEILALKANGINLRSLLVPFVFLGLAIFVIGLLNTTVLVARAGDAFRETLVTIAKKSISVEDREGMFNDSLPGVVIFIEKVDKKNRDMSGVFISDDRDEGVRQTISAEHGIVNLDTNTLDLSFSLRNGSVHRWEKASDTYRTVAFKDYVFAMNLTKILPYNPGLRRKSNEMGLGELAAKYRAATGADKYELLLDLYKKFTIPMAAAVFVLIGVPLGLRRRSEGKFSGVMYSLIIFLSYYVIVALAENMGGQYNISPLLVSITPNALVTGAGLYLIKDLNTEEQVRPSGQWRIKLEWLIAKIK